jgi:hypothetical protein
MNLLRHVRVVALDRGLQEVVRSRHAMPIAAKSWTETWLVPLGIHDLSATRITVQS